MPVTISIITAVYNRAGTVGEALESVHTQSWPHVEHIVIDGGSTDGTLEILRKYDGRLALLVSEPDNGIYEALNKGLQRATGEVVGLLHSDDYFAHDRVLERVATAFLDPSVDAVYGDLEYVSNKGGRVIRRWRSGGYSYKKVARGWMLPHPTLYLRRRIYEKWGLYDTSYQIAADYDLMLRLFSRASLHPVYIPEVLLKMRWGGESNRLSRILRKSYEDYLALRRNGVGGVGALCWKNLSKLGQFF
ncbi:MAG TPA: glycosyltransferase family 2 protein [Nevskiales bacterium]|nr:glycosyltransferase family 2 protein [Nevskiales bacterium]